MESAKEKNVLTLISCVTAISENKLNEDLANFHFGILRINAAGARARLDFEAASCNSDKMGE